MYSHLEGSKEDLWGADWKSIYFVPVHNSNEPPVMVLEYGLEIMQDRAYLQSVHY